MSTTTTTTAGAAAGESLLETESSLDSQIDESASRSGPDSDLDDIDFTQNNSAKHQSINERNSVPKLNLSAVSPVSQTCCFSAGTKFDGSTRVDLLSQAFRIKPELLRQAGESKVSLEEIISHGFYKSLDVRQDQLRFYIVEEITSPRKLSKMTRGGGRGGDNSNNTTNKHIAVAVNSSSFSLTSLESLIEQNKKTTSNLDDYVDRLKVTEDRLKLLEFQLEQTNNQLKQKEEENKRLQREIQGLRNSCLSRQRSTPSPVSDPVISPRLLTTSGGGQQSRLSNSLIHLQQLVTDNQQLTSELCRRVRTQTEIEPPLL
eukprot:g8280.t1